MKKNKFIDKFSDTEEISEMISSNDKYLQELHDLQEELERESLGEIDKKYTVSYFDLKVVNCNKVNVREEPDSNSKIITVLVAGSIVKSFKETAGDFTEVFLDDNTQGYIMSKYLK